MQMGGRSSAEVVQDEMLNFERERPDSLVQRALVDGAIGFAMGTGKHIRRSVRELLQFRQHRLGLVREVHPVRPVFLHPIGMDVPDSGIQVELAPGCLGELRLPDHGDEQQMQCQLE